MPTTTATFQNYATWRIEGSIDLDSSGEITATRGDGMTAGHSTTGLYEITVKGAQGMKLVELLHAGASLMDAAIGTVKDVGVKSVTQATDGTDAVVVTLRTVDAAGADAEEATNALTVSFHAVIRTHKMTNPL
jgi:hypothetical protein